MYYGMGSAVSVRISYFFGQKDLEHVRHTARSGFHIILAMIVLTGIPIFLLRHYIGGWFTNDEAVSLMVAQLIIPFLLYQFGDGLQINFANALRGIADVRPMMLFSFIAYFLISLPAGYLFGFVCGWGAIGIWAAFPFGLTSAGIMYYESLHELPLIANTIARKRLYEMNVVISDTAEYGNYLFANAAVPLLRDHIMPKVNLDVIGKGLGVQSNGVDNVVLVQVNDAIRNHPIEAIGKVLRGYMKDMKRIAVGG
jgi:hypothetical protein